MKNLAKKGFTLVELLVVITILTILSVVAYQSFGWATDKANNVSKKSNITLLWQTLETFYNDWHNYYPMPQPYSPTNLWGYNSWETATVSNKIKVTYNDQEVSTITSANTNWGWIINWTWSNASNQIAAKWVIWINGSFNKKYIKKKIYDTQLWDIKLTWDPDKKMIDYWLWKFTYAVYAIPAPHSNWNVSWSRGSYYELATTLKDTDWEWFITLLEWNYSKDNFNNTADYPETLIWLNNDQKADLSKTTQDDNQWIPYPIDNFAK